ncbi:hypothetical protein, partial [Escherichia coli]|uniref:hypothetical protein n=1 Tax=Escherichia coli TaxID=562 RepID=UPI00201D22B6
MPAVIDWTAGFFCAEGQHCSKKSQNRTLMKPSTKEGLKYQKNSADWIVMIVYAGISGHEISASTEVSTLLRRTSLYIDLCNCLILICSIQHQMKVNLWTKNSYRLWLTNWPKTSK